MDLQRGEFMGKLSDKKAKVMGEKSDDGGLLKYGAIAAIVLVAGFLLLNIVSGSNAPTETAHVDAHDYSGKEIRMTALVPIVENGHVKVPLSTVDAKSIVFFEYNSNGKTVPLMAYVAPSGKVITAVSMCEPCMGTKFFIAKDGTLTCDACWTKWELETMNGISGACVDHAPQALENYVDEEGFLVISEQDVLAWKPRPVV